MLASNDRLGKPAIELLVMQKNAVTLQDIANRAGLSRNTVSCVMRNQGRISNETRKRVMQIAEKLGYRPNPMVSALMQQLRANRPLAQTANLAFLHSTEKRDGWKSTPFLREAYQGAKERAAEIGYNLIPNWVNEPGLTGERLTRILISQGVVGLLVSRVVETKPFENLNWGLFAAAAMGFTMEKPMLHRAGTYFVHFIPQIIEKLTALGYRKIGIAFSSNSNFDHAWEAGLGIIQHDRRWKACSFSVLRRPHPSREVLSRWLQKHQIEVLVCDATAESFEPRLKQLGLKVPQDIGLVALVDEGPRHTAMMRNWASVASNAVDLVVGQLQRNERGIPTNPKTVLIEGQWRQGETVSHLPKQ